MSVPTVTANDLLKRRSRDWFWRSMLVAVVMHAAVFAFAPRIGVAVDIELKRPTALDVVAPTVDLPAPPEAIRPPALPVVSDIDLPTELTIRPTTFDANPLDRIVAPVDRGAADAFRAFAPTMLAPRVLNREEVERALVRHYPDLLRQAGIGGTVDVRIWLDADGAIVRAEVGRSSGHDALDRAALQVVGVMRLSPAVNRDRPVAVIVSLPVRFVPR